MGSVKHHKENIVTFPNGQADVHRWYMNGTDEFVVCARVNGTVAGSLETGRRVCDSDAERRLDVTE